MKARAPDRASFQSTPTSVARPPSRLESFRSSGASLMHGPHQLAQKLTTAGFPRSEASVARGGVNTSLGSAGARRSAPLPPPPLVATSIIASAPATSAATIRYRRPCTPDLLLGQDRHVVHDLGRFEIGRVERCDLAGRADPVDQRRVLDLVRAGAIRAGDDGPLLPHRTERRLRPDQGA